MQLGLAQSRSRAPKILGAIGLAGILGGIAFAVVKNRAPSIDPELIAADGVALELMKNDDEESLKKALEALVALEAKAPEYVAAKADQVLVNILLNRDVRDDIERLQAQAQVIAKDHQRITEKKEGADYAARANAKREELVKLNAAIEPLQEQARKYDERAAALMKQATEAASKPHVDKGALLRGQAMYAAIKGMGEKAEKGAEIYRGHEDKQKLLHDDSRAFADLILAGLHAQPKMSAEMKEKGMAAVKAALQKDPKLVRAKVFEAKMHLATKDFAAARASLSDVVAKNPKHGVAQKLMGDVDVAEAAEKKKNTPPSPEPAPKPGAEKK
jgi:hypothetical protein